MGRKQTFSVRDRSGVSSTSAIGHNRSFEDALWNFRFTLIPDITRHLVSMRFKVQPERQQKKF